jgi:hypothetical protein
MDGPGVRFVVQLPSIERKEEFDPLMYAEDQAVSNAA